MEYSPSENRGGTPTGELPPPLSSPACGGGYGGGQRRCQLHGRLEQASAGFPLPSYLVLLPFVIAGLDPAIQAAAKRGRTYRSDFASRKSAWITGSSPVVTGRVRAHA